MAAHLVGRPVLAVDFDGTLCQSQYPALGEPIQPIIDAVLRRQRQGWIIILWTCRSDEFLVPAVQWCKEHGLEFDAVNDNCKEMIALFEGSNGRKICADEYWDDKAVNVKYTGDDAQWQV